MCVHVCMYMCKCFGGLERAWELLGIGVTVGQELLNVGARDWTSVLCKSSKCSYPLSSLSVPISTFVCVQSGSPVAQAGLKLLIFLPLWICTTMPSFSLGNRTQGMLGKHSLPAEPYPQFLPLPLEYALPWCSAALVFHLFYVLRVWMRGII